MSKNRANRSVSGFLTPGFILLTLLMLVAIVSTGDTASAGAPVGGNPDYNQNGAPGQLPQDPIDTSPYIPECPPAGHPQPWQLSNPPVPPTPTARYRMGAVSADNFIYVFGGGTSTATGTIDLWRWNANDETWSRMANMPTAKQNMQGAYWSGKIYVPGGYSSSSVHVAENAIYDIATNSWSTGAPMPAPRSPATAAYDGKIFVFGGNPGPTDQTLIYNIAGNNWSVGASMPISITYGRAVTAGDYIYYIGGIARGVEASAATYRYDPNANTWTTLAPLNTARSSEELMTNGSLIYAVNGAPDTRYFTGITPSLTVEVYDIAANTWTYVNPTVQTASAIGGGFANGKLMIQGGVNNTTYFTLTQVTTLSSGPANFSDVQPTDYFYEPVAYLYCRGVISGYGDNTFRPYNNTTRGQLTKIIVLAFDIPVYIPPTPTFTDVPTSHPFYAFVETAAHNNIVSGYSDNTFRPYNDVTRGQLSKIVVVATGWPVIDPPTPTFVDVPTDHPFYVFVETAYSHGIISGYSDNTFRPGNNATRGQISKIVYQAVITP